MKYSFDPVKNATLKKERGVSFEDIIIAIEQGYLRDVRPHHNPTKYLDQDILVVEINRYIYLIPCELQAPLIKMKTIYPSRKATAFYTKSQESTDDDI